jgi:hypothetical protein
MQALGSFDMTENPYQSPASDTQIVGINSGKIEDLRMVARYQKGIIVCILCYFVAVIWQIFAIPALPLEIRALVAVGTLLAVLGLVVAGAVFVFLLAMKVYSPALGIVLGVVSLFPCVGLLVLLAVNGKATKVLRENGI